MMPVCVEACPSGALAFGNPTDPKSEVSKGLAKGAIATLRPDLGTQPQVYYLGLDERTLEPVEGLK
jgi:tetrathionate reductase subunit B